MERPIVDPYRRRFLRFLTLGAAAGGISGAALAQTLRISPRDILEAKEALNVSDFLPIAERTMRPAHFGYLQTGVLDDGTIDANRAAYRNWGIRARRLIDVSRIDLTTKLLGETWASPVVLAPVASQRAYHHEAERPVARAARSRGALQILSTMTNISIETVIADRQGPIWFQLYPTNDMDIAKALVTRADRAGASAIVFTADLLSGGMRRETQEHLARMDPGDCSSCHDRSAGFADLVRRKAMFDRFDLGEARTLNNPSLTWEFIRRLRDWTDKKVLVKGIMTPEDAEMALAYGADGLIVSNHGGRAEESLVGTLDALPAIAEKINRRVPLLLDGGIRRGTDVFKALALGASAVCVGRPYIWGLSAFGSEGVEAVLNILDEELRSVMQQAGVTRIGAIGRNNLTPLG